MRRRPARSRVTDRDPRDPRDPRVPRVPRVPLVLATRSAGKIRELTALCAAEGIAVETLDALGLVEEAAEAGIEVHDTFPGNAEAKARWFAARLPGRVVLAEDSGLVVDALGGAPGVHSKRWAQISASGAALDAACDAALDAACDAALDAACDAALDAACDAGNNAALLRALEGQLRREAHYVCVAVCIYGAQRWGGEGRVDGRIGEHARGSGGFGYDPYFESIELGKTFGEASPEEKARVSHRARALRSVLAAGGAALRQQLGR